jgi:hypothetical protein
MRSNAADRRATILRSAGSRAWREAIVAAGLLGVALLGGCAREAPEVREVRKSTQDYLKALSRRDVKEIGERSTCVVSTKSIVGGTVLRVEGLNHVRLGVLDSLGQASFTAGRAAESAWAYADELTADSLFRLARLSSHRTVVYRNAIRAVPLSAPGAIVAADSLIETRAVRVRIRYAGEAVGPKPVDVEGIVRLLRVRGGKWMVFSLYREDQDPRPEMI